MEADDSKSASQAEDSVLFKKGLEAEDGAEWEKAIEFFNKAVSIDGNNANYIYHLAYCFQEVAPNVGAEETAYYKKAIANYKKVLAINPLHLEAWYNLGNSQQELQEYDNAIESCKKVISIDPNDKYTYLMLGNCYMAQQDFEKGVNTYLVAVKLDPDCVMSHYNLASAHHSAASSSTTPAEARKHYKAARAGFVSAIRLNPEYADAFFNLGICYQDERDYQLARRTYSKAVELQPDMQEAINAIKALPLNAK